MEIIGKFDAAKRQLNAAIRMHFEEADPIVVHTLAVASANLFSDILDGTPGKESWREKMRKAHELSPGEVRAIINRSWNFFKHADRDATATLEFSDEDTDWIIFFAILECGELQNISTEMQLFELWLFASGRFTLDEDRYIQQGARQIFQDLDSLPRRDQLRYGQRILANQLASDASRA